MTAINTLSNKIKYSVMKKEVDFSTDVFKLALMNSAFSFDKDTHRQWSNVSSSEIAAGNGYPAGGMVMISGELTEDDIADQAVMTWLNNQFEASGGAFPATGSAIVYDDTHANKIIVGCSDYGVDYTITNGMTLKFTSIVVPLG